MTTKKKYETPQIFEVELNHDQAILATCQIGESNPSGNNGNKCSAGCKANKTGPGGSTASPS